MNLPTLTDFERLLPLSQSSVGETWIGRDISADGLEFVLIEAFSGELSGREALVERIGRGVDGARSLRHDLVVPTRRFGRVEGHLSVVHAFPTGDSLERLLALGRPPMRATLRMFADLTAILADIHESSALHGALHPGIVTVGRDGRARIARFGTERWVRKVRHDWGELDTRQLSYLSPEHCMNDPLDQRTDIFSAGILLWELLTGELLYEEDDDFERMRAICEREAPPPTRFNDQVPPLLNSLTLKALAIEPDERFPNGAELKRAFEGVLSRANEAPSDRDVVRSFHSLAPDRFEGWKHLEEARRQNDLETALRMIGKLFGVDPSRARLDTSTQGTSRPDREATRVSDSDGPTDDHLPDHEVTQQVDEVDEHHQQGRADDQGTDITESPYGEQTDGATTIDEDPPQPGGGGGGFDDSGFEFDEDVDEVPTTIDEKKDAEWSTDELEASSTGDETVNLPTGELDDELDDEPAEEQRSAQSLLLEDEEPDEADEAPTEQLARQANIQEEDAPTNVLDPDDMEADDDSDSGTDFGPGPEPNVEGTQELDPAVDDNVEVTDEDDPFSPEPEAPTDPHLFSDSESPASSDPPEAEAPAGGTIDRDDDRGGDSRADGGARTDDGEAPSSPEQPHEPETDRVASDLRSMSIDEWLEDDDEDDREFREPFSLERVIEDQGEPEQERVRKPALEVIRIGRNQPLDVSVLRGRQRWAIEGEPVEVTCKGKEGAITLRSPAEGWIARASSPGERNALPDAPAEVGIQPGDVAEITDGEVTYRVRFFHPPKSPKHIERENVGRNLTLYGVAIAAAVVLHALAALGIITLHTSFGVAMSVGDEPKKEAFAEGKLEKLEKDEQKPPDPEEEKPPEPPEPTPEPQDPSEQEAEVPEQVQDELDERMEEKQQQAEDKSEAEALAAAFEGPGEDSEDSVEDAVSNIDAAESPSDSEALEVGGKIEPSEGGDIQITQSDGESELGDIGSDIDSSAGKLSGRDKDGDVKATVDSVESQTEVEGQLAREKISKVIQQHQGEIQGCYERELLSNAGLAGKATFEWTVTRQGDVSGVREKSSTLDSPAVSNCIIKILRGLSFPKPQGGSVTISYPFMFRSGG